MNITLTVNGTIRTLSVHPLRRLIDLLRDDLQLTGTKEGCGEGECGACSVIMNGRLVNSCLIPAAGCEGAEIETIEGFAATDQGRTLSGAFAAAHGVQCGFCTPGMMLAAKLILRKHPDPSEEDIRRGISGNLCRCTGYDMIVDAVRLAAANGRDHERA